MSAVHIWHPPSGGPIHPIRDLGSSTRFTDDPNEVTCKDCRTLFYAPPEQRRRDGGDNPAEDPP